MIHYFCTRAHAYTIQRFIDGWDPDLKNHLRIVPYERMPQGPWEAGSCIFTDLERILPWEKTFVRNIQQKLEAFPENLQLWNRPSVHPGRFALMEVFHEKGWNDFRVYRLQRIPQNLRYPVFLHSEVDHSGALTPLLHSRSELDKGVRELNFRHRIAKSLIMVVEFCETRNSDGYYRKYSALKMGDQLFPRSLFISTHWMIKKSTLLTPDIFVEEKRYLDEFPHQEQVDAIFRDARIQYGRIDYGVKDGKIKVWEINTNPIIVPAPQLIEPMRKETQRQVAARASEIFRRIEKESSCKNTSQPFTKVEELRLRANGQLMWIYSHRRP